MRTNGVSFSIASHAAWAPGVTTEPAWAEWARAPLLIGEGDEPSVSMMPAMLRRRAGALGKMALEVAYRCLDGRLDVPTVFCSRHGEAARAVLLLADLAEQLPVSPTGFGLAVHNASAGLFSIARKDQANHIALAAGSSTVEHAVIEACGLLADGAEMVLLVAYDGGMPPVFAHFRDCAEQPHAWAWLMVAAGADAVHLHWSAADSAPCSTHHAIEGKNDGIDAIEGIDPIDAMPASLQVLRFQLGNQPVLERVSGMQRWRWTRDG
jgi:hypothetical protein